ncbi:hypothetical protein [Halapricum hydrolyticum]|uniref:Uncharacterized protein n=1 Tax=Halapricum hydrolyticum TaxID=2979991 RepID=A0AAE3IB57_9EURY|nr:hypothetical protein [Halapricum hydrolyticum]MCU4717763.1 hypothetical protein [Halapricum hydrolyticum]MCU4726927.1 hypothetical protein [Halapricum hydrolyticum]
MALFLDRRQTVATVLACSMILIAGCSAMPGGSDANNTELGRITVENADNTTHRVHVLVERDSVPVYGTSVVLDGVSSTSNEADLSIDLAVLNNSTWTDGTGNWTVYTRVDATPSWNAHAVSSETESACTSVRLKIEIDASVTSFTPPCESWPPSTDTE